MCPTVCLFVFPPSAKHSETVWNDDFWLNALLVKFHLSLLRSRYFFLKGGGLKDFGFGGIFALFVSSPGVDSSCLMMLMRMTMMTMMRKTTIFKETTAKTTTTKMTTTKTTTIKTTKNIFLETSLFLYFFFFYQLYYPKLNMLGGLQYGDFHRLGPLGWVSHRVAMSVCVSV